MWRTCAHVVAASPPSPRGLTSTPRAQLVFFPSSAYSVHSPSSHTHFIPSSLYLCLSPLTRMQAPWGRGVLSVWVPSACPAPGTGAGTRHSQHEEARRDLWERKSSPAASSLPLCSGVYSLAQQQSLCQWDGSQLQAGADTRKSRKEKGKKQNPKDSNPKARPVSRHPSYLSQ